jgi:protein-histidine N-methyltransferase
VPTLLLLDQLSAYLASEPGTSTGPPSSGDVGSRPNGSVPSASVRETHIHLQDYNRSVLELVTFLNVLLAWCLLSHYITSRYSCSLKNLPTDMSPLSATDSDSDSDGNEDEIEEGKKATRRAAHGRKPGGLMVTRGLLDAFTASLDAHKVRLCFFARSWASLREKRARRSTALSPSMRFRRAIRGYHYTCSCGCIG